MPPQSHMHKHALAAHILLTRARFRWLALGHRSSRFTTTISRAEQRQHERRIGRRSVRRQKDASPPCCAPAARRARLRYKRHTDETSSFLTSHIRSQHTSHTVRYLSSAELTSGNIESYIHDIQPYFPFMMIITQIIDILPPFRKRLAMAKTVIRRARTPNLRSPSVSTSKIGSKNDLLSFSQKSRYARPLQKRSL